MTRLAIIADVHGNLPALDAVMADIQDAAPDQVVVAGDTVNRGPQSKECLQRLRDMGWPMLFGNHEEYILKFGNETVPDEWLTDWWLPIRRVSEELSAEEKDYLRTLPWDHVVNVPGLPAIHVLHGSVRALNDGLGFWKSDAELLAATDVPEPVVIGAHTHRPFNRRVGKRWVLNCGSVGAPFNGDLSAQYLLLTATNGQWKADFCAVPYDHSPLYDAWAHSDVLERSMVAQIFMYEVETATFHLTSYLDFCEANHLSKNSLDSVARYRAASANVVPGRSLR